jgi:DNA replication protein DnaC
MKNDPVAIEDALKIKLASLEEMAKAHEAGPSQPEEPQSAEHVATVERLFDAAMCPARQAGRSELSGEEWLAKFKMLQGKLGRGGIFALIGTNGPGKTQMGVECIRRASAQRRTSRYAAAMEFFLDLKASYRKDSEKDERAVIQEYAKPRLLVLDECQERGETEWEDRMLTYLIDRRYREERDTILISNLKRSEFEKSLGWSVISRLNETGGIIECTWPSFRAAA